MLLRGNFYGLSSRSGRKFAHIHPHADLYGYAYANHYPDAYPYDDRNPIADTADADPDPYSDRHGNRIPDGYSNTNDHPKSQPKLYPDDHVYGAAQPDLNSHADRSDRTPEPNSHRYGDSGHHPAAGRRRAAPDAVAG